MKKLKLSLVALFALSSLAIAGGKLVEPPSVPPAPVVTDEWSGPYVGVEAGYLKGKAKINTAFKDSMPGYPETEYDPFTLKPDGFTGGVFAGFNKLLDNDWLIGIEASINYVNAKDESNLYIKRDRTKNKFLLKQTLDYALYARLGKVMGEEKNLMPYLLAGVSGARLKGKLTLANGNSYWDKESVTGWTVGAGLEYKINKNWYIRAQYRYSKYDDAKFSYTANNGTYNVTAKDYKTHSLRVGISYHFK